MSPVSSGGCGIWKKNTGMTAPDPISTGKRFSLIVLGLLALILLTYGNTISSPFNFDDEAVIRNEIAAFGDRFFIDPYPPQYRHLFYLSLAVNYNWGQLNPEGYHLFNLALHFFTAVTVLLIAFFTLDRGTSVGRKAAVSISSIVAFLFALNPVHSETVTYISARASGMAAWFYFLSLLFFILGSLKVSKLRLLSPVCYPLSLIVFLSAVLSKETALTLPVTIILYDLFFMQGDRWNSFKMRIFYYYLPIFAGVVVILFLSPALLSKIQMWLPKLDLNYAASQITVIAYGIKLLFIPVNLTFDYDFNPRFFAATSMLIPGVVFILILMHTTLRNMPKGVRLFYFSILWFLITLTPTNSFLPRTDLLSERNLYLPSFGLILIASVMIWTFIAFIYKHSPALRFPAVGGLVTVYILYSALLIERNSVYRSNILLWEDTVKKSPGKLRALHNLSHFYLAEKAYQKAFVPLKKLAASRASPFYRSIAHNNLGNIYTHFENPVQAEKEFKQAISADPTIPTGHFNMASLHASKGQFRQAKMEYDKAEERYKIYRWGYPKPAELAFNKAKVHKKLGMLEEALQDIQVYLKQVPDSAEGRLLLGQIYSATGENTLAIKTFKSLQGNLSIQAQAHNQLGILLLQNKSFDEAVGEFNQALSLNPDLPDAHFNLAVLLIEAGGDQNLAQKHLGAALRLTEDPERAESINERLRTLKPQMGKD
jgi:tetratricopeptide (TPR) repeat protein